jgi:hypothetical protein
VGPAQLITCQSDEEALQVAASLVNGHDVELWQGDRDIARLGPKRTDGRPSLDDPMTDIIVTMIVEHATAGERDPDHLYQQVLREVMARAEGLREVAKAIG